MKFNSKSGHTKCLKRSCRNSCSTDGKAAAKSKKMANDSGIEAAFMIMASSVSIRLANMERPEIKPLCDIEMRLATKDSISNLTALDKNFLSVFVTFERSKSFTMKVIFTVMKGAAGFLGQEES